MRTRTDGEGDLQPVTLNSSSSGLQPKQHLSLTSYGTWGFFGVLQVKAPRYISLDSRAPPLHTLQPLGILCTTLLSLLLLHFVCLLSTFFFSPLSHIHTRHSHTTCRNRSTSWHNGCEPKSHTAFCGVTFLLLFPAGSQPQNGTFSATWQRNLDVPQRCENKCVVFISTLSVVLFVLYTI